MTLHAAFPKSLHPMPEVTLITIRNFGVAKIKWSDIFSFPVFDKFSQSYLVVYFFPHEIK